MKKTINKKRQLVSMSVKTIQSELVKLVKFGAIEEFYKDQILEVIDDEVAANVN